ncbi:MAG: T9SS type A sorting domain-containing protein, partial [Bacteroidia bacterium]
NKIGTNPQCRINRLEINKSSNEVTLNTPLQISNNLTFTNGILNSDAINLLIFENTSTTTGANNASFVNGPVRKIGNQAFTFPVGKKGDYYGLHFYNAYRPIAISAPANSTHHFTAEYFMQDPHPTYNHGSLAPTITHISNCEYWILDRTNGTSNVNVTLSYSDYGPAVACSGVTNQTDLRVARWNGTQWVDHGNGGTTGTTSNGTIVTSAVVTAFSPFTLASANASNNPLPIELLSFNTTQKEKTVELFWSTASEINNNYFEVEKSTDGINFYAIDKVQGAGNSNTILNYKSTDNNPFLGINYYRIKQVDFDGTFTFSNVIAHNFSSNEYKIVMYPNPTKEILTISNLLENNNYIIQIYDISGKLVLSENVNNSITHTFNLKYLTS